MNTFNQEAKSFQVLRICNLISYDGGKSRRGVPAIHQAYINFVQDEWQYLSRFCGLRFEIQETYYLNPADIGRLGGEFLPLVIGQSYKSRMIPLTAFLCMTSGESVDDKVREHLEFSNDSHEWKVEPLSWFGYGQFQRFVEPEEMKLQNVALVFFQKTEFEDLTDIESVFTDLNGSISCGGCEWLVAIVGLLKGNIDGFVLLVHHGTANDLSRNAEALSTWLSQMRRHNSFWEKTSPVVVYYGTGMITEKHLKVIDKRSNFDKRNHPVT